MSEYLDVLEAAALLRVRESTIYAWVHQRKLPFRKHGRRLAFLRADLQVWSDRQLTLPFTESGVSVPQGSGISPGPSDEAVSGSLKTRRTADDPATL